PPWEGNSHSRTRDRGNRGSDGGAPSAQKLTTRRPEPDGHHSSIRHVRPSTSLPRATRTRSSTRPRPGPVAVGGSGDVRSHPSWSCSPALVRGGGLGEQGVLRQGRGREFARQRVSVHEREELLQHEREVALVPDVESTRHPNLAGPSHLDDLEPG